MNTKCISIILFVTLFLASPSFAAKKGAYIQSAQNLGATFLLIGTSASQAVDDILKGAKKVSKQTKYLSKTERNFLFGYANYKLKKYNRADRIFKKLLKKDLPIEDYLLFYRADIAFNQQDYKDAYVFLVELLKKYPDCILANKARIMMGQTLTELGNYEKARSFLEYPIRTAYNDLNSNHSQVFAANLSLIKNFIKQGNQQEALMQLKNLALNAVSQLQVHKIEYAAKSLSRDTRKHFQAWLAGPEIRYAIAESFLDNSQWYEVINQVKSLISNYPLNAELGFKARRLNARAHYRLHKYHDSIDLTKELLSTGRNHDLRLRLLRQLARSYARTDDYEQASISWQKIIEEYSKSRSAVLSARFHIALLLVDDGKYEQAIQAWKNVLKLRASRRQKSKALWFLAWSYYKAGHYNTALKRFDYLLRHRRMSRRMKDRLLYWKARVYEKMGQEINAKKTYNKLLDKFPLGYYAFLAHRRLNNDIRSVSNFEQDIAAHAQGQQSIWRPSPLAYKKLVLSDHLTKAMFFDQLKLFAEAAQEIEAVIKQANPSPKSFILWLASRNQAHNLAYRLVRKEFMPILQDFPKTTGFDLFIWQQAYPQAYQDLVQQFAGQEIDPDLVYSLMRAESTYRPKVVSSAGAIGLMQLMPTTAKRMSDQLGESNFDVHNLYKPAKNIEYGVTYLKKLYELFPNNTVAVLASYNAGEEAVARWIKHGDFNDIEEFIEEIPYTQTNQYVKKVLRFYWLTKRLY